jgi:hypothetical protein
MAAAPQKLRHKNKHFMAHMSMRHRFKEFCGAPEKVRHRNGGTGAPQNFILVRH